MSDTESNESIDQLEAFQRANVKPGMFVSGWDDPNDEVYETKNPHESLQKEILWAVDEGKYELVDSILTKDPTCKDSKDGDGYTPLHKACYNNHMDIAKLLIQYGADVNARTELQWTPLHSAAKWSNAECVALLLQHGADANAGSEGLQNPLHIAATVSNCRPTAMTLLMDERFDAAAKNNSDETAGDIARRTGLTFPIFEMGHSAFTVDTGLID